MKILVTPTSFNPAHPSPALTRLQEYADEIVYNPQGRPLTEEELIPLLEGCEGYVAGLDYITAKVIRAAESLRVISRYGAGVDRVDLDTAKACGITVCNTPGANAQAVADLAITLALCAARRVPALDKKTREGEWVRSTGIELYRKTMGIVGLGAIGKAVAQRAQGFSMKVIAYDPYLDNAYAQENSILPVSFEQLLAEADVVSLHLPLNNDTRHILDGKAMRTMKRGAILVNTARGGLIDEDAAYQLLCDGYLGGMGLDAFEQEPPTASPLFELDNVVLTPHTASHTYEATVNMASMAVDNLIAAFSQQRRHVLV